MNWQPIKHLKRFQTLRGQFLFLTLPPVIFAMAGFSALFALFTFEGMSNDLRAKLDSVATTQSAAMAQPLWNYNFEVAERIADSMLLDPDVRGIRVVDTFGDVLVDLGDSNIGNIAPDLVRQQEVVHVAGGAPQTIGILTVVFTEARIFDTIARQFLRDFLALSTLVAVIVGTALFANRMTMGRPLEKFMRAIRDADERGVRGTLEWDSQDELGRVIGAYNQMLVNLSEGEAALAESRQQLQTVTDNLPGAVFQMAREVDGSYQMVYMSRGIEDLLGVSPEVFQGSMGPWGRQFAESEARRAKDLYDRSAESGERLDAELRMTTAQGKEIWVRALAAPRPEADGSVHWDGILLDVTDRKELESQLRRLATTDSLTGLWNRRHFIDTVRNEILRARRHDTPLTVAIIDCDHFKRVNDTYGHGAGDEVLRTLARTARRQLREIDVIGRLGGEEFALALVNTAMDGARLVAERLRETVANIEVESADGSQVGVTVSIGLAELATQEEDITQLLNRADKALYAAKESGRNRVVADIDDAYNEYASA